MEPITPIQEFPKLATEIGYRGQIWLKREDLHPYGSHKGRSIPVMIDHYISLQKYNFAISSSGNAALAAAMHVNHLNEKRKAASPDGHVAKPIILEIFVGGNIAPHKLEKIYKAAGLSEYIKVTQSLRPLQALAIAIDNGYTSLRQSTDDTALVGYESLAKELADTPKIKAIFIGASSGTTAQALAKYFRKEGVNISLNIIQTTSCHPFVDSFEKTNAITEPSIADAIVDKTAFRKNALHEAIISSGGSAYIASNKDIIEAQELVSKTCGINISTNSALSIVGLLKYSSNIDSLRSSSKNTSYEKSAVCIICGD